MANNQTPEEILREILGGGATELDSSDIRSIEQYKLRGLTNLTKVNAPNCTSVGQYAFYGCSGLQEVSLPGVTSIGQYAFYGSGPAEMYFPGVTACTNSYIFQNTKARAIYFPNLTGKVGIGAFILSNGASNGPQRICLPKVTGSNGGAAFRYNHFLEVFDYAGTSIGAYEFENCYVLSTLILRKTGSITTIGSSNMFLKTPLSGYQGRTATVYVPRDLISSYENGTNWASRFANGYVTFVALEGSPYESETWWENNPLV